jgi:hypothetical protein
MRMASSGGLSVASSCDRPFAFAPQKRLLLIRLCFAAPAIASLHLVEVLNSVQPFTRPQRPAVTGLPRRGQRSRPTPSLLDPATSRPAGFELLTSLRLPAAGTLNARCPLPGTSPARPEPFTTRYSPPGFPPRDRSTRLVPAQETYLTGRPLTSRSPFVAIVITANGSSFQARSKKVGSACASRFFFDGPSIASVACDPKITARFRGGRVSELSSLAGSPFRSGSGGLGGRRQPSLTWLPTPSAQRLPA